jgi:hypothetical protein
VTLTESLSRKVDRGSPPPFFTEGKKESIGFEGDKFQGGVVVSYEKVEERKERKEGYR